MIFTGNEVFAIKLKQRFREGEWARIRWGREKNGYGTGVGTFFRTWGWRCWKCWKFKVRNWVRTFFQSLENMSFEKVKARVNRNRKTWIRALTFKRFKREGAGSVAFGVRDWVAVCRELFSTRWRRVGKSFGEATRRPSEWKDVQILASTRCNLSVFSCPLLHEMKTSAPSPGEPRSGARIQFAVHLPRAPSPWPLHRACCTYLPPRWILTRWRSSTFHFRNLRKS